MHWRTPSLGDERIVRRFLFLPTQIGYEWKWLEFAKIRQVYSFTYECWVNEDWSE